MFPLRVKMNQRFLQSFVFVVKDCITEMNFSDFSFEEHETIVKFYGQLLRKAKKGFQQKSYTISISEDLALIFFEVFPQILKNYGAYENAMISQYILQPINRVIV